MRLNKRGMEMAIQIFIVLFVLLAVAMLVLQMVSTQISEQQKRMNEKQLRDQLEQKLQDMRGICDNLCAKAAQEGTLRAQAAFCLKNFPEGVDLTLNLSKKDYDEELLAGVGVCEDALYCPLLVDCKAGANLNMENCIRILCEYWENEGFTPDEATANLNKHITPGSCYDNQPAHWYTLLLRKFGGSDTNTGLPLPAGGLKCG